MLTAGISLGPESFVIISDKNRNVHILKYDYIFDNYYRYQTLSLDSPVISLSSFNLGTSNKNLILLFKHKLIDSHLDSQNGEAYLCIVTKMNKFYLYTFQYLEGWKPISHGKMDGIVGLVPFKINKETYLFAPSKDTSNLLSVVKQG